MIRMIQSQTAARAKAYFNEALQKSDYYVNDQELNGRFQGSIASRLGISEMVTKKAFHALCENTHPVTGTALTPRKTNNRTVGYDINFHCPKSVSILHALSKDKHILDAFQKSVCDTMSDIEKDAKTRVRKNGQDENRSSDGLLYADFIHQTARPVKGEKPDPHLHCHCFVFNVTWDQVENTFKAGQFRDIKRDMPYYQAMFHKRLADNLMGLGYKIKVTKSAFEIEGVPEHIVELFSKRTNEIGQLAKEHKISDAKKLDALGGKTRAKKQKGLTMKELKNEWVKQIKQLGLSRAMIHTVLRHKVPIKGPHVKAFQAIDFACLKLFERASVVQDRRILMEAIRFAIGFPRLKIAAIHAGLLSDKNIVQRKDADTTLCTTQQIVQEEQKLLALAKDASSPLPPLYKEAPDLSLTGEQRHAVEHILTTPAHLSIIVGRAGTGKTTLMQEAVANMEEAGKSVLIVAPTAQASRGVLKQEGFENAETVAKILNDKSLQDQLQGQVLWVDEAGLIGTADMVSLLELSKAKDARVILSGDTKQHSSVVRGDALRFLTDVAGVRPLSINKIHRQKNEDYRKAIEALSIGNADIGYNRLDKLGAILEVDPDNPNKQLVVDYLNALGRKKSVLIVSPTHQQSNAVTSELRDALKAHHKIGKVDHVVPRYVNLNMTVAEKQNATSYQKGNVVRLNQAVATLKRGSMVTVEKVSKTAVLIIDQEGNKSQLSLNDADKFDVYHQTTLPLAKGDRILVTRNGIDANKKRLNNGQELEVARFHKSGAIIAKSPSSKANYILPQDFGHINHAYCITSHASQGKTVDHVFISQPSSTFPASDLKQFYVSASRGRESISIYTDDKENLLFQVKTLKQRQSALELLRFQENMECCLEFDNNQHGQTSVLEMQFSQTFQ